MKHIFVLNKNDAEKDLNEIIKFQAKKFISEESLIFIEPSLENYRNDLINLISNITIDENEYFIFNPYSCILLSAIDNDSLSKLISYLSSQDQYKYIRLNLLREKIQKCVSDSLNLFEDSYSKLDKSPHIINKKILLEILSGSSLNDEFNRFWLTVLTDKYESLYYFNKSENSNNAYFCKIYEVKNNLLDISGNWNVQFMDTIKEILEAGSIESNKEFTESNAWSCCRDMGKSS